MRVPFEIRDMKKIYYMTVIAFLTFSCAQQKSIVKNQHLDSDLDGIHDSRDACPKDPGSLFNLGCPENNSVKLALNYDELKSTDADLDGVKNEKDECPEQYGSPFNQGCPFMIILD